MTPCKRGHFSRRAHGSEQRAALVGSNAHAQCVQLDEACRIRLIVGAAVFFEGGDVGVEQRLIGLAAGDDHVALVQLQAHDAVHVGLGSVDHLLQHQTLRAPPVTGVDQAGILGHQLVFKVGDFTVQGDGLDGAVGTQHDVPPGVS